MLGTSPREILANSHGFSEDSKGIVEDSECYNCQDYLGEKKGLQFDDDGAGGRSSQLVEKGLGK